MEKDIETDYYKVLQCERTSSIEEIKRNYQRLLLTTHPDKSKSESHTFHLIQKAWSVLREPETRKLYDAELSCKEHSELLLYDTITLSEMDYYSEEGVYTYSCRCGGTYLLENLDIKGSKVVIGCDECSFSIEVSL